MDFELNYFVEIKIGDYFLYKENNQFYYINKPPRVVESPGAYKYECIFESSIHELRKTKIFLDTPKETGFYRDYKFPLTGNAQTFLLFIVGNLNRNGDTLTAGTYTETDTITIDFNNWNAFEAIRSIAEKLGFNWFIENNVLNFAAKETQTSYVFQVGRKKGFSELTRALVDSVNIETVVYGYGSTENMPPRTATEGQTYDSDLLTENRLTFTGVDGESKLTNNTALFGEIESVQEFPEIKPEFTGTVSAIDLDTRIFYDNSIDFDINVQLLAGILPKIKFLTGKLIGLTFNISFEDATDKITMDIYTDESGAYPNDLIFASVGDTYKLFDIVMPESYIIAASTKLQAATQSYLDNKSNRLESYTANVDREFIQGNNISLNLGDLIRIVSTPFQLDALYPIKELTQKITDRNDYSLTFGDSLPKSLLASLKITNFTTEQSIYQVKKSSVTNNSVTNILGDTLSWE